MFRFKRFTVKQEDSAMKVGTDGVLLGAWCSIPEGALRALDIGTGTGVISLMLAQRGESCGLSVDAVEIDESSARQAGGNFAASPWADRLRVFNAAVQDFALAAAGKYDLIVSNPPYFVGSLLPPDPSRAAARHTNLLAHAELLDAVSGLLHSGGTAAFVLPCDQAATFVEDARRRGLFLCRRTDVKTTPAAAPKRVLLEFRNDREQETISPVYGKLTIEHGGKDTFTEEYRSLTGNFYLKF